MRVWGYVATALTAAIWLVAPAIAQQTISKAEVRGQEPAVTDAQLRDQLWGLFRKEDRRRAKPPTQPLTFETLVTTPYPAGAFGTFGLCRVDVVAIELAPVRGRLRDADAATPMRAYGVQSRPSFLVLPLSPEERGDVFDDKWNGPCAKIGQPDPRFFRASSEEVARQGYALLMRAAAAAKSGELIPRCDGGPCSEELAAFASRPFYEIRDCTAEEKATCYKFTRADDVEVKTSFSSGGPLQVEITKLLVLRHPRPD